MRYAPVKGFKQYMKEEVNRYRFFTLLAFIAAVTLLSWQSDDAYHAYVMAKHLVEGDGFVYNIGERASASSCPLFTLAVAAGYFFFRNMFLVSIAICVAFSSAAYYIVSRYFCRTKNQVLLTFAAFASSVSFMSYTASGLENCMLYFLAALFMKIYFSADNYSGKKLFGMAVVFSLFAMCRMDAVLLFIPLIVYAYLFRRERSVSFLQAVGIGLAGLLPFILWELFSTIYYGFPVPNTAFVKLGTEIPKIEYIKRGVIYYLVTALNDILVLLLPFVYCVASVISRKIRHILLAAGIAFYGLYVLYIGGDFMMGRHFTVMFFLSVCGMLLLEYEKCFGRLVIAGALYALTIPGIIGGQFLYGNIFYSPISDERAGYFPNTSLFNNVVQYSKDGTTLIRQAWNEEGIDELREQGKSAGILKMVPGISIYYNSDMYLNDMYALGDPFLSKLPAIREDNWRIGHMQRDIPAGYIETVQSGENKIENPDLREYYEVIKKITRGDIWEKERLSMIIKINMGAYDYLIESYKETLDENNRQVTE